MPTMGPEPIAPVEPVMTPEEVLQQHEGRIATMAHEEAVIIDSDGNMVFSKMGKVNQVEFTPDELAQLRGNVMTHNHPMGSSFSVDDVKFMAAWDMEEMRAVGWQWGDTPIQYRYKIHPDAEMRRHINIFNDAWDNNIKTIGAEIQSDFLNQINQGALTVADANAQYQHELWIRFDKLYTESHSGTLNYSREVIP